jgi:multiple sugar transport system ATP-binding protein
MRVELKKLHLRLGTTAIYVTHDQVEAMTLGDRVVVMKDGVVQQVGEPLELYNQPANKFVAGFIGAPAMNFVDVTVRREPGGMAVESLGLKISVNPPEARAIEPYHGKQLVMGIRPEHLFLGNGAAGSGFDARVEVVEQLGSEILLETRVGPDSLTVARVPAETKVALGDQVRISAQLARLHFFDPSTELPITG